MVSSVCDINQIVCGMYGTKVPYREIRFIVTSEVLQVEFQSDFFSGECFSSNCAFFRVECFACNWRENH